MIVRFKGDPRAIAHEEERPEDGQVEYEIFKESGRYWKAMVAVYDRKSKKLSLFGVRIARRHYRAYDPYSIKWTRYHIKTFESVLDPEAKLRELGFEIKEVRT